MTTSNTNNLEIFFQDLSEEDTANITGGEGVVATGNASASFENNVGGIAQTSVITSAVDQGTHKGTSQSTSASIAFNDTQRDSQIFGPSFGLNFPNFLTGL
ncbi:hypothetical protein [Iningainema tapete]|uniref:Bacteriocin n=1 Tax=Iningainema tapete BLCC-T55 TaxID=2748662 RepID=A0A8J6XY53_9CYAN|nr:hypothetical protein [Iningainema tapete]MBD2778612.1 hypothetical protein [Iningainema tapete BLCC-T55]